MVIGGPGGAAQFAMSGIAAPVAVESRSAGSRETNH